MGLQPELPRPPEWSGCGRQPAGLPLTPFEKTALMSPEPKPQARPPYLGLDHARSLVPQMLQGGGDVDLLGACNRHTPGSDGSSAHRADRHMQSTRGRQTHAGLRRALQTHAGLRRAQRTVVPLTRCWGLRAQQPIDGDRHPSAAWPGGAFRGSYRNTGQGGFRSCWLKKAGQKLVIRGRYTHHGKLRPGQTRPLLGFIWWRFKIFIFLAVRLGRSLFPDQGLNPGQGSEGAVPTTRPPGSPQEVFRERSR